MSDVRKRRWYQFSLRMLLAAVTVSALGMAWWKHRDCCLRLARLHAERNVALAGEILRGFDSWDSADYQAVSVLGGDDAYSYSIKRAEIVGGCRIFVLTVDSGNLPDEDQRLHAGMLREAELADKYCHAIWRPWERLWIEDVPPAVQK